MLTDYPAAGRYWILLHGRISRARGVHDDETADRLTGLRNDLQRYYPKQIEQTKELLATIGITKELEV